ncbi:lipoprotein involved with copper homeostasis and adhesion, partial [Salmonella enterica subsp. enterica serovar Newport str. Pond080-2TTA]
GKRLPVASNAQLERGYLAAKGEAEKPVLLTVEGHFVLAANPDTGEPVKTLIADKNVKFAPGKDCTH